MQTIPATMCVEFPLGLDYYFDRSRKPLAVYCSATLAYLGSTEGPATRDADGAITLAFAGARFVATPVKGSRWYGLAAAEGGSGGVSKPVTPETLGTADLQRVLDTAHEWPMHVRHAASAVMYSPGATGGDCQRICDAINARRAAGSP